MKEKDKVDFIERVAKVKITIIPVVVPDKENIGVAITRYVEFDYNFDRLVDYLNSAINDYMDLYAESGDIDE